METKQIDYYGDKDNYIHLKFGDCVKAFNFTEDFKKDYPTFVAGYNSYWDGKRNVFKNALQVISYIYNNYIPVNLYFNYTDTPVKDREEVEQYFIRENNKTTIYDYELKGTN